MSSLAPCHTGSWLSSVTQLLDEHHLVMLSDRAEARASFCSALRCYLGGFPSTQVLTVPGRAVTDLAGFGRALGRELDLPRDLPPDLDAIVNRLRVGAGGVRRRYLLWSDADEMLEADVSLFSRLVNALLAVAVEHEFISLEPLVLQRVVFIGGAKLGAYTEEEGGQFCRWLEGEVDPSFWEVPRCLDRPRVLTYRLDG